HYRLLGLHTLPGAIAALALLVNKDIYRVGRIFWLVTGIVTWGGMLWSGGRTPVIALGVAVVGWAVLSPVLVRRELLRFSGLLLIAGLALSAAFWTPNPELGWWHAIGRTATAASTGSVSQLSSTRTDFWLAVVQRAKDALWFGHGPDAYRFLTPKLDGQQPHNFILQFWLDLGVVGAVPLLVLLGGALVFGWRQTLQTKSPMAQAWLAVLTASLVAGLLDGVFYHLLAFLPAMLAVGVAIVFISRPVPPALSSQTPKLIVGFASLVSLVHLCVFYLVAVAPPPAPTSWQARTVRIFPSTTFGLWRWLDDWQQTHPADVLEWTRWAQTHSPNPVFFHVYAADLLKAQGHRAEAKTELEAALAEAHWSVRPSIEARLRDLPAPGR
ncbi:MAG: O-antigen ligase family protein, partial [Opitutaceae bacterium]